MTSSLYVHIPFCRKKCAYCDFFSLDCQKSQLSPQVPDSYLACVIKEASFYADFYNITSWKSIYIGGGTPSLLSPDQVITLIASLRNVFKNGEKEAPLEITMEMNGDDVSRDFLLACAKAGVSRLSMGIQALDNKALDAVGRNCRSEKVLEALQLVKENWQGRFSVDFIAGLPRHSWLSFQKQFSILNQYPNIDHVSLYTLTIEENTPLARKISQGRIKFSPEKADRMWIKGRNILEKMGFAQYEVSNFSRPGYESLHNNVYWSQESYCGLGAGASGTIYDFNGEKSSALRWANTSSLNQYCRGIEENNFCRQLEEIDEETLEFEFLMLGFRRLSGVREEDFYKRFGKSLAEKIGALREGGLFYKWKKEGLARQKNGSYSLNRRGILLLNRFLEDLI